MFKIKKQLKSEQGISLLEVVASIVIIGVILISFFNFFINSAKFNSINDANIQAASVVRDYAAKFNEGEVYYGDWKPTEWGFTETTGIPKKYTQTFFEEDFIIEVTISSKKEGEEEDSIDPKAIYYRELRKVHIEAWKGTKSGNPLSETYLFHEGPITTK